MNEDQVEDSQEQEQHKPDVKNECIQSVVDTSKETNSDKDHLSIDHFIDFSSIKNFSVNISTSNLNRSQEFSRSTTFSTGLSRFILICQINHQNG